MGSRSLLYPFSHIRLIPNQPNPTDFQNEDGLLALTGMQGSIPTLRNRRGCLLLK